MALDDSGSDGEGDDDDGDFRELPAFETPTKFAAMKQQVETKVMVTGPNHFPAEVMEDPWIVESDPWASASSTAQSTSALPVPSSWNYEFDKASDGRGGDKLGSEQLCDR